MTTRLVLLRHGQTDWNVERRFQGQADIGLNALGREQALAAAPAVAREGLDVIVSSPLSRALDTARRVAEVTGLPVVTDERLQEVNVGTWAGLTREQMAEQDPASARAILSGGDFRRSPTGETAAELGLRVGPALADIAGRNPGGSVLVASHGMAIRMGVAHLLGWSHGQASQLAVLGNCSWAVLAREDGADWRLAAWNRRA